jgi:hypothetical protein
MAEASFPVLRWRKSSASFEGNCVAVAAHEGLVMIRDTNDSGNLTLTFLRPDWDAFLALIRHNVYSPET